MSYLTHEQLMKSGLCPTDGDPSIVRPDTVVLFDTEHFKENSDTFQGLPVAFLKQIHKSVHQLFLASPILYRGVYGQACAAQQLQNMLTEVRKLVSAANIGKLSPTERATNIQMTFALLSELLKLTERMIKAAHVAQNVALDGVLEAEKQVEAAQQQEFRT